MNTLQSACFPRSTGSKSLLAVDPVRFEPGASADNSSTVTLSHLVRFTGDSHVAEQVEEVELRTGWGRAAFKWGLDIIECRARLKRKVNSTGSKLCARQKSIKAVVSVRTIDQMEVRGSQAAKVAGCG